MYEKRFSVWVDGSDVNEYLLTKESADAIVVDEDKTKRNMR